MSLKVMFADDEAKLQTLLRSVAVSLGHTVLPFDGYEAALQKLDTQRFDLALLGMDSVEMDGIELAHRMRHSARNREAIIVMLTQNEDIPSLRKALGEGADLIVTKPIKRIDCVACWLLWILPNGEAKSPRPDCLSSLKSSARRRSGSLPCAA